MERGQLERPEVAEAKRVVVKVGTRVLTRSDGRLSLVRLSRVVELAADLRLAGREVLIVSSGAIGLGRDALGLSQTPTDVAARQACAAVGQSRLMALYQQGFAPFGVHVAQLLLTEEDFSSRTRYLNLRAALSRLLKDGVVPIINENDVVATAELALVDGGRRPVFGDNDRLSALVASELDAHLLVLLTDVDGVYDRDPNRHEDAARLDRLDRPDEASPEASGSTSGVGRGGMSSKLEAASVAARSGCHVVIASGLEPDAARRACEGEAVGTWIPATTALSARKRWIAFATRAQGALHLDDGAVAALLERHASVLAAGVTQVDGDFDKGDVVELRGPRGEILGRGVAQVSADGARAACESAPSPGDRPLVRREQLVLDGGER